MPSSACDWSSDVCSSDRSEEHTSELQSRSDLVCRLLLEKKKKNLKRTVDTSKLALGIQSPSKHRSHDKRGSSRACHETCKRAELITGARQREARDLLVA